MPRRGLIALLGSLAAIVVFHFIAREVLDNYVLRVLSVTGINVMLAVSLNLVNGTTGQFSIGHAGFMAVGAYAGAVASHVLDAPLHGILGGGAGDALTLITALIVAALFGGLAGVLVGVPSLRLRGDYLAIVTLGFGEIIRIVLVNTPSLGGSQGYPIGIGSVPPYASLGWIWATTAIAIAVVWNITYSSHGRVLAAIREDEIAAEAVGVATTRYKVLAFAVSAAVTAVAGALFAHDATGAQHIDPQSFRLDKSVDMLVMIIFGGLGSITGAVVGGLFVSLSLELLRELPNLLGRESTSRVIVWMRDNSSNMRLMIYALLLVLFMLLRPQGLLGNREFSLASMRRLFGRGPRPTAGGAA